MVSVLSQHCTRVYPIAVQLLYCYPYEILLNIHMMGCGGALEKGMCPLQHAIYKSAMSILQFLVSSWKFSKKLRM